MEMNNYFDISRFLLLLKLESCRSKKGVLMTLVIIMGLVIGGLLLETLVEYKKVYESHQENYAFVLIIGGFIISSLAFNDLGNTLKRSNYLSLPASAFEKFASMWLLTSVGWTVLFTLCFTLFAFVANTIGHLLFREVIYVAFNPLGEISLNAMLHYFVLQGIFLVGAVHFKGYVFPKTMVSLILIAVFCGILIYFSLKDIFLEDHECTGPTCELLVQIDEHPAWTILQWIFYGMLAPVCWLITYVGIKDQEV